MALAGLLLALPSCLWPAPGAGPDRRAHNAFEKRITPDSVADLEEIWSAPTPSGAARSPVTSDDAVHVAANHRLYSFDKETGSELWVREDPDLPDWVYMGPATFADDLLWLGYGMGNLGGYWVTERVDPATGEVVDVPGPAGVVDGVRGDSYLISTVGFGSGGPAALSITIGDTEDPSGGWSASVDVQDFGAPWSPLTLGREHAYQAGPGILDPEGPTQGNGVRGYSTASKPECPPDLPDSLACPTWATELDGSFATSPVLGAGSSTLYIATDAGTV